MNTMRFGLGLLDISNLSHLVIGLIALEEAADRASPIYLPGRRSLRRQQREFIILSISLLLLLLPIIGYNLLS